MPAGHFDTTQHWTGVSNLGLITQPRSFVCVCVFLLDAAVAAAAAIGGVALPLSPLLRKLTGCTYGVGY